jgi:quercetin dioxygenase-like cupin family protein
MTLTIGCVPSMNSLADNRGIEQSNSIRRMEMLAYSAKGKFMKFTRMILALACLMPAMLFAQQAKVTPLLSKDLPNLPGKEGLMITVVYPPGSSDPIHRHFANAFVYVLEGSIVMQVRGGKETTLTPGQTFYEGPDDIHIVGRNASQTKQAKFVVFLVKDKGAPVLVPAK